MKASSISSSRLRRSSSRSRARSDNSSGGSSAACAARYFFTQPPTVVSLSPYSRDTSAIDRAVSITSLATSSRNSGLYFSYFPALLTDPWVFGSARQRGSVAAEGEHGQGDQCLRGAESERNPVQEPDLGVGGFDQSLREAMIEGGVDGLAVAHDAAGELDEHRDPAAARPGDPPVQGLLSFFAFDREHMPQAFFEQIGPIQPRVGLGDPGQFGGLSFGQVFGVFPQRIAGALEGA